MLGTGVCIERRTSDRLNTLRGCLALAFRPHGSAIFEDLLAAIDATDELRQRGDEKAARTPADQVIQRFHRFALGEISCTEELTEEGPALISREQMIPLLLDACPSFREHWDGILRSLCQNLAGDTQ